MRPSSSSSTSSSHRGPSRAGRAKRACARAGAARHRSGRAGGHRRGRAVLLGQVKGKIELAELSVPRDLRERDDRRPPGRAVDPRAGARAGHEPPGGVPGRSRAPRGPAPGRARAPRGRDARLLLAPARRVGDLPGHAPAGHAAQDGERDSRRRLRLVENLRPREAPASLGYVHAPSVPQAVSAAILRSGHLAAGLTPPAPSHSTSVRSAWPGR